MLFIDKYSDEEFTKIVEEADTYNNIAFKLGFKHYPNSKNREKIKNEWMWFVRVMEAESRKYYAGKQIQKGEICKKTPVAKSIKEIMRGVSAGKD